MNCEKGVTLIELLIVLAVLGITLVFAVPHFAQVLAEMEAKKVESNLRTLLSHGKQQAYIHRQRIAVCGSDDGTTCNKTGWSKGVIVFKDTQVANRNRDSEEKIIQQISFNLKYGTLNWQGALDQNPAFQPDSGLPRGANGKFKYCSTHYKKHFNLIMSDMGHLRLEKQNTC